MIKKKFLTALEVRILYIIKTQNIFIPSSWKKKILITRDVCVGIRMLIYTVTI